MIRCAAVTLALLAPLAAQAEAPSLIPVTGYLTDDAGAPITDSVALRLSLYAAPTGGSAVWSELQAVEVDGGQFTVYLGSETPLDLSDFRDSGTWYLGMALGTDAELTPRFHVATAPFAAYAQYCEEAAVVGGIDPADIRLLADPVSWSEITSSTLPAGLADGDNDTKYTAGTGVSLTGTEFSADKATIDGWAKAAAYDTLEELRIDLDAIYAARQTCTLNQVLAADSSGAWVCTDSTALPLSEGAVDFAVSNNGYALATDLATTNANLATTNTNLATTAADLVTTNTNLATTNTGLATTNTNLATTNTTVSATSAALTTLSGRVTAITPPTGIHNNVFQYNTADNNAISLQLKTQWRTNNGAMYRVTVQGYMYGVGAPVNSDCVGYLYSATDSIVSGSCNNYAGGATLTQYKTSDGYLAFTLSYGSSYYMGITVSYTTLSPTGDFTTTFTPFKQNATL